MIKGIGTDIVQIPRIEKMLEKHGEAFAKRILSGPEMIEYDKRLDNQKIEFLAKRYAAKEAVAKAFGVGIAEDLAFHDIEIYNNDLGAPKVRIHSEIGKEKQVEISISDDYPIAVAFAVISQ